ncbi:hypothetical protein BYT27DRAFT_7085493 [Phlegmacium glaucopus]|nr:hypothetical protein BYT27DRAFT_7085493 [Phlegmacium glaucopus]
MDERIVLNPHLEVMPDHAGPHFNVLRNALMQNGLTIEQAIQAIDESWTQTHNERIQRWDQQVVDDAIAEEALGQQQPENLDPMPQEPPERVEERAELEKRKPKMKDFDDTAAVGNYIAPRPAQYALRRIEDFEYVELWYLTPEGCTDATQHQLTQNDDTFGLTKVDDMVTLKSVSSLKASKNVIPDNKLSFRQMSMAKNTFIQLMTKYQWSKKAINAFAHLFTQLELHPYRQREFGERALIIYQARVRREWHDQLKLGSAFNIGIVNEVLLQSIYKEILDKAQLMSINEVSNSYRFSFMLSRLTSPALFHTSSSFIVSCHSFPLHHVTTAMRHAPCTLYYAPRITHHAPRTMHHAPCTMHHVSHTTRHAPGTKLHLSPNCIMHH